MTIAGAVTITGIGIIIGVTAHGLSGFQLAGIHGITVGVILIMADIMAIMDQAGAILIMEDITAVITVMATTAGITDITEMAMHTVMAEEVQHTATDMREAME